MPRVKRFLKRTSSGAKNATKNIAKKSAFWIVILAFIAGLGGGIVGSKFVSERTTSLDKSSSLKIVSNQSQLISSIAKEVGPSVVSINYETKSSSSTSTLQQLFGTSQSQTEAGAGTGIIISSDGTILTNKHVIPDDISSVSFRITTSTGKSYTDIEVLARDPRSNYDVAFLKIKNVNGLQPAALGDSSKVQVGDSVVAIGYALGEFENTVTSGIISGTGRPVVAGDGLSTESLTDLLQTDAAINSGNSGGPLLSMSGEVIGLNTAVASNAQNIGFSIPINSIKSQINSILNKGKLEVPYLGVRYIVINQTIKDTYKLSVNEGAWLQTTSTTQSVINNSPADKAGLKEGDIITKVDNKKVTSDNTLSELLSDYKVGDTIKITYVRDGDTKTTEATLEVAPSDS